MSEYRRLSISAHRSIAFSSLALILALLLSGSLAAPAAGQVLSGGTGGTGVDSGVTAADETIDEWENDILNNPAPDTQEGFFDWLVSFLLDSLGLEREVAGTPVQPIR